MGCLCLLKARCISAWICDKKQQSEGGDLGPGERGAGQRAVTGCRAERARDGDSPRPLGLGDPTCRRKSGAPAMVAVGTGRGLPVSILKGRRQQRRRQHNHLLDRIYDACLHSPDQQKSVPATVWFERRGIGDLISSRWLPWWPLGARAGSDMAGEAGQRDGKRAWVVGVRSR